MRGLLCLGTWLIGIGGFIAAGCITDPGQALLGSTEKGPVAAAATQWGEDHGGSTGGSRGADDIRSDDSSNGNEDDDDAGNDNGGKNGNDNGGVKNANDNGVPNANDNGAGGACPDGSTRLRVLFAGVDARVEYNQSSSGCTWFRARTQGWPQTGVTLDVTVLGTVVGQIMVDDRGRGELVLDESAGTLPPGFPDLVVGDVAGIGDQGGALASDCSMLSGCNENGNTNGNANDNGVPNGNTAARRGDDSRSDSHSGRTESVENSGDDDQNANNDDAENDNGVENENENDDADDNGNDNGGANSNAAAYWNGHGSGSGGSSSSGRHQGVDGDDAENENGDDDAGNDNGGVKNANDNGVPNANDNGAGGACPDGSTRLRVLFAGVDARVEYNQSSSGCTWFRARTQGWPQTGVTLDVTVLGTVVGQIMVDDRGRGELVLDESAGTLPPGFPDLVAGDVAGIGDQGGALASDCSMLSGCNENGNDNSANGNVNG